MVVTQLLWPSYVTKSRHPILPGLLFPVKFVDATYQFVTQEADRIEHEIWMIQVGGALWRLFLAALPKPGLLAETLMHVARLEPRPLEQLMMDLVEFPMTARATIADLLEEEA